MQPPLPSIQRRILSFIMLGLLTMTLALTAGFGLLSYYRLQNALVDRMNIAVEVAWEEYEKGPRQLASTLQAVSSLDSFVDAAEQGNPEALSPYLSMLANADFAAVVDENRRVVAHTASDQIAQTAPFPHLVDEAVQKQAVRISTELVGADWVAAQMPSDLSRLNIPLGCDVGNSGCIDRGLVQMVVVPTSLGSRKGVIMAGILLNNTQQIPRAASDRIPGSYLSIAGQGFRVSANINTESGPLSTGGQQSSQLLSSVNRGERYYGTVPMGRESHWVASDPIRDSSGQVIGALTLGLPPSEFAQFGRQTLVLMLICALVATLASIPVARYTSRKLAQPIISLEQDVMSLASAHGARELQQAAAQIHPASPALYSQEVLTLHQSFRTLAESLVNLTQETETYLERLEGDKAELEAMTEALQESKTQLEKKVDERTQELETVVLELRQASALKSQFLATMSHELRTPLNSVIGFSEMMVDQLVGPINPKQQEYLGHILSSARHLLQIVSDILDLSRIEQGRMVLDLQDVLLPELVESVEAKVTHQAESAGLTLQVESDPTVPPVKADPTRLKEVLYNLLSNAIKFTPSGGTIWIRLLAAHDMAVLEVEDTGIGMRPEDQEVVFNEFVQCESAYHRRFEGVGLGLPISKKLIELHGGRIELTSELGRGTRVRCYLPPHRGGEA